VNTSASQFPLHWIPLLPLLGAALNLIFGRKLPRKLIHAIACSAVGIAAVVTFAAVLTELGPQWWEARHVLDHAQPLVRENVFTWIQSGSFKVDFSLTMDTLSAIMTLTVTFVGFLIHVYSTGYMSHDPRPHTYFGYLNLFTGAMLILVLGDSLPVMFIGWEGVGLCSYLLIGFWFDKEKNADAGRKAFVVNRIGDFAFLLGIFLLFSTVHTVTFEGLREAGQSLTQPVWGMPLAFWSGLLLFIGACGKSAQIPLYVWLPDAMAGPTPVSALIHAATMVTAGVYMVVRLGFLYVQAPQMMAIIAIIGTATALMAALIGFAQTDIKKVLAYSTVSQLGFMFAAAGCGAFNAAIFHLFTHAFFKAGLFLGAGSVMHAMGDRTEIMEMGGLKKKIPITHLTFKIYCLAIAGIPFFAGFFSKDDILLGAFTAHFESFPALGKIVWVVLSATALGTAFYMWRLYYLVFSGESRADAETQAHIHESPSSMTTPLVVLAVGATVLGFIGLPHFLGHVNLLGSWLDATFRFWPMGAEEHEVATAITVGLMGFATLCGIAGIFLARYFYKDGPEKVRGVVAGIAPLHKLVANKFYVDELYDLIIVRPFRWLATATYNIFDRFVIDLVFVNGAAFVTDVAGRLLRFIQNGDVQRYFGAIVFGVFAMIVWTTCLSDNGKDLGFSYKGDSAQMSFKADVGKGPSGKNAEVRWDFDADGNPDSTVADTTWTFKTPGKHKVKLWVQDSLGGKVHSVEHIIDVHEAPAAAPEPAPTGAPAGGGGQ
jgi:NADH-quinone oxidoreductase subunit L